MRNFRSVFRALIHLSDTPERTALAFALGVFLGFSPLIGLHTVLGLLLAFLFRLNRLAVILGVWSNLPWLIVPFYAFSTWLGVWLLGLSEAIEPPELSFYELFRPEFWEWLLSQWRLLIPAFWGSLVLATLLGLLAYPIALFTIRKYRSLELAGASSAQTSDFKGASSKNLEG